MLLQGLALVPDSTPFCSCCCFSEKHSTPSTQRNAFERVQRYIRSHTITTNIRIFVLSALLCALAGDNITRD